MTSIITSQPNLPQFHPSASTKLQKPESSPCRDLTASEERSDDFQELVDWMGGEFSSARQAALDPSRFEVNLGIRPIWDEHSNYQTQFYYVEQSLAGQPPYRQRVYRLSDLGENRYASAIFEVPFADKLVGATSQSPIFKTFGPTDLNRREGCDVFLKREEDGYFRGNTEVGRCSSTYLGADYTMSNVTVGPTGLDTWDQGFLSNGEKVWGADSPYRFDRV